MLRPVSLPERALACGAALTVGLAAAPPTGLSGDLLRGLLVLLWGLLLLAHARWDEGGGRPGRAGLLLFLPPLLVASLQVWPWPRTALEAFSPTVSALYLADEGGGVPAARPATLEAAQTARIALLGWGYLAAFCVLRGLRLPRALAVAGVALASGAAAWGLLALGLEPQRSWAGRASGPFVNPNHLCAFLVLGLGLALGVAGGRLERGIRTLALGAVALQVVAIAATRSRAGIVAALLAAAIALIGQGFATRRRKLGLVAGLAALLVGLALSDREAARARFAAVPPDRPGLALEARAETWSLAWARVKSDPLVGQGLGSFDLQSQAGLLPEVQRWTRPGAAHQDYLELAGDLGLPATLLALGGLVGLLAGAWRGARRARGTPRAARWGAWGGLAGLLAHSLVDFPLQQPGVASLALLCLALALGRAPRRGRTTWGRRGQAGLALALAASGAWLGYRGWVEEQARQAYARIGAARPALRAEQAKRVLPALERAADRGARGQVHAWFGNALLIRALGLQADGQGAEARELLGRAREQLELACEKSPGDARFQLQLASLLQGGDEGELREAERRLELALARAPAQPAVLFGAGEVALELRARTGQEAYLALAERCLRRALIQRPSEGRRARALVERYLARLGRRADALRARLLELERELAAPRPEGVAAPGSGGA